jgi:hypothetical protein
MTRLLAKWGSRSVRGRALIAAGVVTPARGASDTRNGNEAMKETPRSMVGPGRSQSHPLVVTGRETNRPVPGLRDMATTWRRLNASRDHRWTRPRSSAYVEGELAPRDERRLAGHAELCPDCAYLIATLEVLLGILPALRLPPDIAFAIAERTAERVRARIEECG